MRKHKYIILSSIFFFCFYIKGISQTYLISAGGNQSTCSGNFYDSGNSGGNYGNNENYSITFCPSTAGQYMRLTFSSFSVENNWDYLYIYDGNSINAPLIGMYTGTTSPGTITASNSSGCLTVRFSSDGATVSTGWAATLSCVASAGSAPGTVNYLIGNGGSVSTCSGNFYDPGFTANYFNNQNYSITFCPSTAGQAIRVTFSAFNTESGFDYLYIYNGPSIASPLIGSYSGSTSPGTITSSDVSGCLTFRFVSDAGTVSSGWVSAISCVAPPPPSINMTNGSLTTCNATFYDNGGSGGNYTNNQNLTYTFCPATAGQYIRVAFTSWGMEANFDFLSVYDGNSTAATMIVGSSFSGTSPGTITATTSNSSGCLTFKFYSDGATVSSGWAANVTCVATGATPPASFTHQDCYGAYVVCSDANFNYASSGPGVFNDANLGLGNLGCLNNYANTPNGSAEHQSVWAVFSPSASGTVGMTLDPAGSSTTDYDWAIWGPYSGLTCPPTGNPLRCSAAAAANSAGAMTGMGNGATDTEEPSGGNGWVSTINVTAGQYYVMMVDNWNATSAPLTLSWQLSGGASLNCTPLPIELIEFKGKQQGKNNYIEWVTASEVNNDFFTLEKSSNGIQFSPFAIVRGAGTSTSTKHYSTIDDKPYDGTTYYRLKQTDFNGLFQYSDIIYINNKMEDIFASDFYPNPTNENINFNFYSPIKGTLKIEIYDYTGKLVSTQIVETSEGTSLLSAQMENLAKGIYSIKTSFNQTSFTAVNKVVKN
jgi:hypothetical protein